MEETNNKRWKKPLIIIVAILILLGLIDLIYFGFIDKKEDIPQGVTAPLAYKPEEQDLGEIDVAEYLKDQEPQVVEKVVEKEVIKEVPVEKEIIVEKNIPGQPQIVYQQVPIPVEKEVPVIEVHEKDNYITQEVVKEVDVSDHSNCVDKQIADNWKALAESARIAKDTYEATHSHLDSEFDGVVDELDSLKTESADYKSTHSLADSEWLAKIDAEYKPLADYDKLNSDWQTKFGKLQGDYDKYILDNQDIIADYKATIKTLEDDTDDDVKELIKQNINLKGKVQTLTETLHQYMGHVCDYSNCVSKEEYTEMSSAKVQAEIARDGYKTELADMTKDRDSWKSKYDDSVADVDELTTENARLESELSKANSDLEDAQPAIAFYNSHKDFDFDKHGDLKCMPQEQYDLVNKELTEAREEVARLKATYGESGGYSYQQHINCMPENEWKALQSERDSFLKERDELNTLALNYKKQIEDLQAELDELKSQQGSSDPEPGWEKPYDHYGKGTDVIDGFGNGYDVSAYERASTSSIMQGLSDWDSSIKTYSQLVEALEKNHTTTNYSEEWSLWEFTGTNYIRVRFINLQGETDIRVTPGRQSSVEIYDVVKKATDTGWEYKPGDIFYK